jgi:glutamyl-tRNA synthetase
MSDTPRIRARFAPSPTGYLHVGGARTALFNWLFCRKHGGTFILRIEDTDILRNVEGAEKKLLDDLKWLGIDYDEGPDVGGPLGPYRQSERREFYDAAAKKLLKSGDAYFAFDTPDELETLRRRAALEKRSFRYPRPDPLPTKADADRARADGRPVVVRFKVPNEAITVHDEILGDVTFGSGEIEDLVIIKSNGWPTYHFAVVVDDARMQITHVLRAQEHLMNSPKHVFMQRALGYSTPRFAHLPLVFNYDGTKMSKRDKHKAVRKTAKELIKSGKWTAATIAELAQSRVEAVEAWLDKADSELDLHQVSRIAAAAQVVIPEIDVHDFRLSGYLPEALTNFIALIGWSPGDDREFLSRKEMIDAFSLDRINKTAGRFDREKLLAVNTSYCASVPPARLLEAFRDWAAVADSPLKSLDDATAARVLELCKGMRILADVEYKAGVLLDPDDALRYDPDAVTKVLCRKDGEGYKVLQALRPRLALLEPWTAESIDGAIRAVCRERAAGLGDVAQPLRVAIAGRAVSPAIAESLELLGKARTLRRVQRCLETGSHSLGGISDEV